MLEGYEEKHHRFACSARIGGGAVVLLTGLALFSLTFTLEPLLAEVDPQPAETP
jgi:hypothetical protein